MASQGSGAPRITLEEFVAKYLAAPGMTEAWLAQHGLAPVRCRCGEEFCDGWVMRRAPGATTEGSAS